MVKQRLGKQIITPDLPHRIEGSPLIRLIGDEFASNAEASLYKLEDLTSAIGGGVLTNTNSATFEFDADLGHTVVTVDGINQLLERVTEGQFEVGTGSFIVSFDFKTTKFGATEYMVFYGDNDASEQNYGIRIGSDQITAFADDGTVTSQVVDSIVKRWQDGKWHTATMILDTSLTTDTLFLWVDGELIGSNVAALATLNNASEQIQFGARNSGALAQSFYDGKLANFHIIKAADYNATQVLNQGIRESVSIGTHTLTNDSLKRLNNQFNLGTTLNDYTTTVIDVEEGEYELQTIYEQNTPSFGTVDILIDEKQIDSIVTLGTLADNSIATETGIKLSAGKHILKIKNTLAGQISINFINLIKREGHEQGGATKFLLLFDELQQRTNHASIFIQTNSAFYNNVFQNITDADGQFFEGDIFIKGGLYNIELVWSSTTNAGQLDLDFGNVEVLDQENLSTAPVFNEIVTKLVRLNQGKNTIRGAMNGTDNTDFFYRLHSLRGERIND